MKVHNTDRALWLGEYFMELAFSYKSSKKRGYRIPGKLVQIEKLGEGVWATGYNGKLRIW